ncbi:MAG: 2Fe-2S iron-sulfur cluster-binding protein [Clostridia bacterium]
MKVEILRCKIGGTPYRQTFLYNGEMHRSVAYLLDTLNFSDDLNDIDGNPCGRIAWECSCRQKLCGACAMVICNIPALACSTFLDEIKLKNDTLVLEPLSKFPVIEDLRVERSLIFETMKEAEVWLEHDAEKIPAKHFEDCYLAAKCLKCGLCLEVCPNYCGGKFAGAAFVTESYLTLCQGGELQKNAKKFFLSGCSKSGACEQICPVGMNTLSMLAQMYRGKYR